MVFSQASSSIPQRLFVRVSVAPIRRLVSMLAQLGAGCMSKLAAIGRFSRTRWRRIAGAVEERSNESARVGLCVSCVHARRVESVRGAVFYRCGYSDVDPSFPKYPQLPVHACAAYGQGFPSSAPDSDDS